MADVLSLHGVGLSLGGAEPLNQAHLGKLKALVDRIQPSLVSEHLCWVGVGGVFLNDLLPLPYTEEALSVMATHVLQVQDELGRRILIENPSSYLTFAHSTMSEPEFLGALVAMTDCGLLLDINNVHVAPKTTGSTPRHILPLSPPALSPNTILPATPIPATC